MTQTDNIRFDCGARSSDAAEIPANIRRLKAFFALHADHCRPLVGKAAGVTVYSGQYNGQWFVGVTDGDSAWRIPVKENRLQAERCRVVYACYAEAAELSPAIAKAEAQLPAPARQEAA